MLSFPHAPCLKPTASTLLRTPGEYLLVGGKQGFKEQLACGLVDPVSGRGSKSCSVPDVREPRDYMQQWRAGTGYPRQMLWYGTGVKLSRANLSFPWNASAWSSPHNVLSGSNPAGCVDRRPITGYPLREACEFDGRLSLAQLGGRYFLYARANLRFGAVAGGRYVQVPAHT